jgi:hypothetical protein
MDGMESKEFDMSEKDAHNLYYQLGVVLFPTLDHEEEENEKV